MATMTVEGRRIYIKTQYGEACVAQIKALGAHWDGDRRAWWITSAKRADVERIIQAPGADKMAGDVEDQRLKRDQNNILGRATYDDQVYYLVGQGQGERGPWVRLMFCDGSKTFFKNAGEVEIIKTYQKPQTLKGLQEFAERKKREAATGVCECSCHSSGSCTCGRGFCSFHHDGCDACGCES